ncbi:MAG: hypothetical protein AAF222_07630 [Pseudomonadota bacterium]
MNTHVNPDKGVRQVAPGVECKEMSLGANVTCLAYDAGAIYAGLGDGRVVMVQDGKAETVATHAGAVTGLVVSAASLVISSGQDGRLLCNGVDVIKPRSDWITALCQTKDHTRTAVLSGRAVNVIEDGQIIASLDDFPSTVTGAEFFGAGNRLAISHYGGLSLWSIDRFAKPERLTWAGSMISASVSPDERYIAGATQDREVHVWDFAANRDFRLGGYRTKVKSMGWSLDVPYLYTTGADALVAWGLAGDPGAFPPKEIGYAFSEAVSAVSPTAQSDRMPAGFTDGSLLLGEVTKGTAKIVRAASGGAVTKIITAGDAFCFGTQSGEVGVFTWQI